MWKLLQLFISFLVYFFCYIFQDRVMFGYSKIPIQTSLLKLRYADLMDAVSMFKLVCTLFSFWAIKNRRNPRISFWVVCLTLWFTKKTPPQSPIHLVSFCFRKVDWSKSFRKFVLICLQYGELPGCSPSRAFLSFLYPLENIRRTSGFRIFLGRIGMKN